MGDSTTNLISRLSTRFDNAIIDRDKPDYLTRDIGGHFRKNQPYIGGYFQVIFGLPELLFGGADQAKVASRWLHSTCEGFTPHSQTMNTIDIVGQGQIGSSFVTGTTVNREFTMTFREYQNLPILNIIKRWCSVMDNFTGTSPLDGNQFLPINYKGWCAVAQTKPVKSKNVALTAEDIEECYIYPGVIPMTIPLDALNSDVTSNEAAQLSVSFKFDNSPLTSAEPGVINKVVELLAGMTMLGDSLDGTDSTYQKYWNGKDTMTQWGSHKEDSVKSVVDPEK